MIGFGSLLLPLALVLYSLNGGGEGDTAAGLTPRQALEAQSPGQGEAWLEFAVAHDLPTAHQVRIEQRVTLRISPHPGAARQNLSAILAPNGGRVRLAERAFADCLPIGNIAGVRAQRGNRLLLFLRDRRLLAADLEKACTAQNFYAGFYVEQNEDGRLCVDRDRLQSRNGAKCSVSSLRQIVAIAED